MRHTANLNIMQTDIYSIKRKMPSKSPNTPSREVMASTIRTAWERGDISQKQVAVDLGIHQSQFSKLVNGQFKQTRGHAARLFEYSISGRDKQNTRPAANFDTSALRMELTQRLMLAWDGTEEGARALEAILDGVLQLRASRPLGT
ncbi:helix-turn-helix domain-containing protein [Burkholderia alba]|uniref:hypothetical protein n=1 Tax=Burkholderia alba TaxID=2683677 RepID=UPI002B0532D3|nr:hypothetical protein [Burkholderia alba]